MKTSDLLNSSTRVALAAFLHDLGKFAERAGIAEAEQKDADGNSLKELNKQQYCPNFKGRYSHVHAAYTAIAMDVIEKHLPDIKKSDCAPFASWSTGNMTESNDSLINAAARHHKPETFLQWVIATADRLSSGFERSQFDEYNQAEEGNQSRSYKTARMEVLLEKIALPDANGNKASKPALHRYALKPLSPEGLIPIEAKNAEPSTDAEGTAEYKALWDGFLSALQRHTGEDVIPQSHKQNLPLWLDHFDSLWLTFTHAIPSATASKVGNKFIAIPADVSLYDHAKSTAALATALWRWHDYSENTGADAARAMREGSDYNQQKFLLIQGDMFGIQDFIFQQGGSTTKYATKLLRGRSFYVSLMAECAALRVLQVLDLPPTSQITNAAGKFLIVAPNTPAAIKALEDLREEFNQWSLNKTQGRSGLGLAWTAACSNDFITNKTGEASFSSLLNRLFNELEQQKYQRLELWKGDVPAVLTDYLQAFSEYGVCDIDGVSPALERTEDNKTGQVIALGQLALDQITIGRHLAKSHRVLITQTRLQGNGSLKSDILGLFVHFTHSEEVTGRFAAEAASGNLLRCWDFSLPNDDGKAALWNGYARRYINGYVARFQSEDFYTEKYKQFEDELETSTSLNEIKTFNHLACENRLLVNTQADPSQANNWIGTPGLHALKGDVDNLGAIFQSGYEKPNFAKMAGLSRQINAFFSIYLPWLCKTQFKNTYTVFAGGDDFFLLGAWKDQMQLALTMHKKFNDFVAKNASIHFSAGLHLSKPGLPITTLSHGAEEALDNAKAKDGKNAITCFNRCLTWDKFQELIIDAEWLNEQQQALGLSTGFIYSLLELADMADAKNALNPNKALWRSQLTYRTARWINDKRKQKIDETPEDYRNRIKNEAVTLTSKLAKKLQNHGNNYNVALYTHLYTYRD